MSSQLNRLSAVFLAAFLLVAGAAGYWAIVRASDLTSRGDNPRRILLERRIPRGPILDRNGQVLAESIGPPGDLTRHYPYPALSSLLGYVSPLYGLTGLEAAFDPILHGDEGYDAWELWQLSTVLGGPPAGRAIRLTLDLRLQQAANTALGDQTGAVVVLNTETGEILALASQPTYDANDLDSIWSSLVADPRSPLLNRATLGLYQPGAALAPAILALGVSHGVVTLDQPASTEALVLGGRDYVCLTADTATPTLVSALRAGCPAPLADLGTSLGSDALHTLFTDLRLYEPPAIGLPGAAASTDTVIADASLAALGQDKLAISPLQLALVMAAVAESGRMPAPQLVLETQDRTSLWQPLAPASAPATALPARGAEEAAGWLADGVTASAVGDDGGSPLAWFAVTGPAEDAHYAVVVLLENGDVTGAEAIGREVLAATRR